MSGALSPGLIIDDIEHTLEVHRKRTVAMRFGSRTLQLHTAHDLFSSQDVDVGTRMLLRTVSDLPGEAVLDLGCGYGALGLVLGFLDPARVVHLVDRDALAVGFSTANAALNGIANAQAYASLGYDDVRRRDFDLVVCNLPGKAGTPVLAHLVADASAFLRPGGLACVVVVSALHDEVAAAGGEAVLVRRGRGHSVFHFRSAEDGAYESAFARGVYRRSVVPWDAAGRTLRVATVFGLPEFDTPSYATSLAAEAIGSIAKIDKAVVVNPGQGHLAVLSQAMLEPRALEIVDRDLLALRTTEANLAREITTVHAPAVLAGDPDADLVVFSPSQDQPMAAMQADLQACTTRLAPLGRLIVGSTSTIVTRCEGWAAQAGLSSRSRVRRRGHSVAVFRRS